MIFHHNRRAFRRGFTLIEMMAVVFLMLVLLSGITLMFFNGRQSVKLRQDASSLLSYMRTAWDYAKACGQTITFSRDAKGRLHYTDPRSGRKKTAQLTSKGLVAAMKINERWIVFDPRLSAMMPENGEDQEATEVSCHLSEGRGLLEVSTLLVLWGEREGDEGVPEAMVPEQGVLGSLHLLTGRTSLISLDREALSVLMETAAVAAQEQVPSPAGQDLHL